MASKGKPKSGGTFRELLEGAKGPGARPSAPAETFETLLKGAEPLPGARRVASALLPGSSPRTTRVPRRESRERETRSPRDDRGGAPEFVIEREDGTVRGHRRELGPGALASLDRGRWKPQRQLDLHHARVADVGAAVASFVADSADHGLTRVLFIHGKGLHSPSGAGVLGDALVDVLTGSRVAHVVRAFRTAPIGLGGSGALIVELTRGPRRARE